MKTKVCSRCKEDKPITEFYKNQNYCKECNKKYHQEHKESCKIANRKYLENNSIMAWCFRTIIVYRLKVGNI